MRMPINLEISVALLVLNGLITAKAKGYFREPSFMVYEWTMEIPEAASKLP